MRLLKIEKLTKRFGGVLALDQVSFEVDRGKIVSIIGPNGAGKTTLFNCVTGIVRSEEGSIRFGPDDSEITSGAASSSRSHDSEITSGAASSSRSHEGEPLEGLAPHQIAQFGIARTFQNIRLFANMSVLDNVLAGTYVRTKAGLLEALWPFGSGAHQEERWAIDRSLRLLEQLGLISSADHLASALSYGQQRRLELARALASDPELLLLDEPAAGLTFQERQALMEFLKQLKSQGLTILLIEHDMRVVMPISDWVVVLDYGEKIAEGLPKQIQEDPRVIEAYLGVKI